MTYRALTALKLPLILLAISGGAAIVSVGLSVRADPTADATADAVPFSGTLAKDGVAFDGTVDLSFHVYDGLGTPSEVWSETQTVMVEAGRFSVLLGDGDSDSAVDLRAILEGADDLYVQVGMADGDAEVLFPQHHRLVASPATIVAKALSGPTIHRRLAITATKRVDGTGTDGSVIVHDDSAAVLAVDGNDIDSTTALSLNGRSLAGVTTGGTLDVYGMVNLTTGTAGGQTIRRSSNFILINNGSTAFSGGVVFDSAVSIPEGTVTGLDATMGTSAGGFGSVNLVDTLGSGSGSWVCPDGQVFTGGRFIGDHSDGKVFTRSWCGVFTMTIK